jgi:hypothetical protein
LASLHHRTAVNLHLFDEALRLCVNGRILPGLQFAGQSELAIEFE